MSTTLDGKLLAILLYEDPNEIEPLDLRAYMIKKQELRVEQIKAAFQEAGYINDREEFARLHQHLKELEWLMRTSDVEPEPPTEIPNGSQEDIDL